MALLNYSTTVSANKTVSEIENILAKHRARTIMKNYDDNGLIESLSFEIETPQGFAGIRLPINTPAITKVLENQYRLGKIPRRFVTHEQAVKIAWRIIKDWVEAQMAILETEMVKMEQIFLPYIIANDGKTLFEVFESRKMLTSGK